MSCSFYLYRFRKYVSYGFPIINFRNPGVHYETPCMFASARKDAFEASVCPGLTTVLRDRKHSDLHFL
jgi:hypothetical protein